MQAKETCSNCANFLATGWLAAWLHPVTQVCTLSTLHSPLHRLAWRGTQTPRPAFGQAPQLQRQQQTAVVAAVAWAKVKGSFCCQTCCMPPRQSDQLPECQTDRETHSFTHPTANLSSGAELRRNGAHDVCEAIARALTIDRDSVLHSLVSISRFKIRFRVVTTKI